MSELGRTELGRTARRLLKGIQSVPQTIRDRRDAVSEVDPELRHPRNYLPLSPVGPKSLALVREFLVKESEPVPGVSVEEIRISSPFGGSFSCYLYQPEEDRAAEAGPVPEFTGAVLWIHGGGTIAGTAAADHAHSSSLARDLRVPVLSVDYRLAPEHPFPVPFEDCFLALNWLHNNAFRLRIDREHIAVAGMSAGGLLAAAVAQRAFDENVPVCFQALLYPMLDDNTSPARAHGRGRVSWSPESNVYAWTAYLGHAAGESEERPYAVPARRSSLVGLAPAWIGVGDLDLFYEEDLEYARRLEESLVPCELVTVPGMYHAAENRQPDAASMKEFTASYRAALRRAVSRP